VSSAALALRADALELPWTDAVADERRFRFIAGAMLGLTLVVALIVPYLNVSAPLPRAIDELSPRLARLLDEQQPVPLPPVETPVLETASAPVPEPVAPAVTPPKKAAPPKAPPQPSSAPVEALPEAQISPQPAEAPVESAPAPSAARERAARSGLLALSQEVEAVRTETNAKAQTFAAQELKTDVQQAPPSASAAPARDIITSQAGKGSGGISGAASASSGTGGTQLAGRETTRVAAPTASAGGGGGAGATVGPRKAGLPPRSIEEIQRVFDQQRAALNTLYNRALRTNPALKSGTVVLKLVILPSGAVAECSVVSSELGDPDLERKLVARIRQFDFGARDNIAVTTITYPIDFFPG
jgi:TonB family protein